MVLPKVSSEPRDSRSHQEANLQRLRFVSTTASPSTEGEVDTSENEVVAPDFTNRNPRNLELLALARKERGWKTTWPKREFWHRLRLERTQHYAEAFVERCDGDVVEFEKAVEEGGVVLREPRRIYR
nr:PREDICTED: 39S ribosomal protein L18, mitochondrial [Opisthocomus hoazin]